MARPLIVIIGAGFGGLSAAHGLAGAAADVTVIDRRNYHLFQPLLYQVATAGLSPAQIAQPIRSILRRAPNVNVLLGEVLGIDKEKRTVMVDDREVSYDHLIVATGARHSYFGHDDWESVAPGLKNIDDATSIRRRILMAFEHAEAAAAPEQRRRFLTFVVIGGGPTGVEMAGAIAELAHVALRHDFRSINPRDARIVLVEAGPRLLPALPRSAERGGPLLARTAACRGAPRHVSLPVRRRGRRHRRPSFGGGHHRVAAGVMASNAAQWLGADKDGAGQVKVGPDLSLPGHPEIFVLGDTALALDGGGRPLPGLAPVAKQQGAYVARLLRARLAGPSAPRPFRYRSYGTLATIGRRAAVADFGWIKLDGTLAWLLWGLVHISFLIGFRNRLVVMLDWLWSYVNFQSGARLITGSDPH